MARLSSKFQPIPAPQPNYGDDTQEVKALLAANAGNWVAYLTGESITRASDSKHWRLSGSGRDGSTYVNKGGKYPGFVIDYNGDGESRNPLEFAMHVKGWTFAKAMDEARDWLGLGGASPRPVRRAKAQPKAANDNEDADIQTRWAASLWKAASSLTGTPAEVYLRYVRGIPQAAIDRLVDLDLARFSPAFRSRYESIVSCRAILFRLTDFNGDRALQAVKLMPDGSKLKDERPKLNVGPVGGAAFRLPGVGRLILCEGPEEAASLWAATGRPVVAAMGGMAKLLAMCGPGDSVTVAAQNKAPDQPGKPARTSLDEAVAKALDRGVDVEVVRSPPGDWNDLLIGGGIEAVAAALASPVALTEVAQPVEVPATRIAVGEARAAVAEVVAQPHYPAPTMDRETALRLQSEAIRGFIAKAAAAKALLNEFKGRRADAHAECDSPAEKGKATRAIKKDMRAEHGDDALVKRLFQRLLLTGSQGTGKSRTAMEAVAEIKTDMSVWFALPTLDRAAEAQGEYARMGGSLPSMTIRGRRAQDPEKPRGCPMCERWKLAEKLSRSGVSTKEIMCETCPFRGDCGYLRQEAQADAMNGRGVFFLAHNYLFLPACPAPKADLVIADESIRNAASGGKPVIPIPALEHYAEMNPDVYHPLGVIAEAFREYEGQELHHCRAAMTHDQIQAAIDMLQGQEHGEAESWALSLADDQHVIEKIDDVQAKERRRIAALLGVVRVEMGQNRATFNAVKFKPNYPVKMTDGSIEKMPALAAFPRSELRLNDAVPLLLMDGTGNRWINQKIVGSWIEHVHFPVERDAEVIGIRGKSYSHQSVKGEDAHGTPSRPEEAKKLRSEIVGLSNGGEDVFFAGNKDVVESLVKSGAHPDRVGHFNATRGMNLWEKCETAVVVGREQPPPHSIEDDARCLLADEPEPLVSVEEYVKEPRGRRMRDGSVEVVMVDVHPDKRVQRVFEQIREVEILQALDRVRPIFNHRKLILLNDLVVDVTYDRTMRHKRLVGGGERWEQALDKAGALLLRPDEMHKAHPDLWETEEAARLDLKRSKGLKRVNGVKTQIDSFYLENDPINSVAVVNYRVEGQRGQKPSKALVDLDVFDDPVAAVKGKVPNLKVAEVVWPRDRDPATQAPVAEAVAQSKALPVAREPLALPVVTVREYCFCQPGEADPLAEV